ALAVNELVTNAIKYGALSVDTGRVAVTWTVELVEGSRLLELRWRERGGPAVLPSKRESFGSQLLKRVVPSDFGGTATLTLEPEGVAYTLRSDYDRLLGASAG
ncbi:sensor histidine kinase, partial [Pseudomonas sp. R2.Fl]|nr:sensor histidine kinase [Pseudomonas sp. R2.Fl]